MQRLKKFIQVGDGKNNTHKFSVKDIQVIKKLIDSEEEFSSPFWLEVHIKNYDYWIPLPHNIKYALEKAYMLIKYEEELDL